MRWATSPLKGSCSCGAHKKSHGYMGSSCPEVWRPAYPARAWRPSPVRGSTSGRREQGIEPAQPGHRLQASLRRLGALDGEVAQEVLAVLGVLVEMVRREHGRDHGHAGVELHVHQRLQ
eukprot:Opistho-1_new@106522